MKARAIVAVKDRKGDIGLEAPLPLPPGKEDDFCGLSPLKDSLKYRNSRDPNVQGNPPLKKLKMPPTPPETNLGDANPPSNESSLIEPFDVDIPVPSSSPFGGIGSASASLDRSTQLYSSSKFYASACFWLHANHFYVF